MPNITFEKIKIEKIAGILPETRRTKQNEGRSTESDVRVAEAAQTTSDLLYEGAKKIISETGVSTSEIGAIVFASTSPDYRSPATACVLHGRLSLSKDCIAYDMNIGGAGFPFGLQVGGSILQGINKDYLLLLLGDTTSKQLSANQDDPLGFGDGAAVVLLKSEEANQSPIHISTGSQSDDYQSFIIKGGGFRNADGLNNHAEDYLSVDTKRFLKKSVELTHSIISNFIQEKNTDLAGFDLILLPQLGAHYFAEVSQLLKKEISGTTLAAFSPYGVTRGASCVFDLLDFYQKEPFEEARILNLSIGEGVSWGISSFMLRKNSLLPLIETDSRFDGGKIAREI